MNNGSTDGELTKTIIHIMYDKKPQTVRQLINLTKVNVPQSEEDILTAILKLQDEGKIRFDNHSLSVSVKLSTYLKTSQALWYWTTVALSITTIVLVFFVGEDFYPWSYFRNVIGVIFVIWLPGYAFLKALFPAHLPLQASRNLGNVERIALSVIMSLALIPIFGLILNYSPWGIRLAPLVLTLLVFTLVFATAALIREYLRNRVEKHPV